MSTNVTDATGQNRSVDQMLEQVERARLQSENDTAYKGGGEGPPGGEDMRERVAKLEVQFGHIDARLDRIEDKMLTAWDVAKVQAGIIVFAMALIMLGPRLLALLPALGS